MVAMVAGRTTTFTCRLAPPPFRLATEPVPEGGVAAYVQSIPQRASISGAPGKNRTQAAAAATITASAKSNCFQVAIGTPVD
jgi:hypothetical protein